MASKKTARVRKTQAQWNTLQDELLKDANFTVDRINQIALDLQMEPKSVYKWVWDHTKGSSAERMLADALIHNQMQT